MIRTRSSSLVPALACLLLCAVAGSISSARAAESGAGSPALTALMPAYDAARSALADDSLGTLASPARDLRTGLAALTENGLTADAAGVPADKLAEVKALLPALRKASEALAAASSLSGARDAFNDLSKSLIAWRKQTAAGPDVGFCPMVGRSWLQAADVPVENPYGGRSMAGCGDVAPPEHQESP
jgi:hypothetical protein